MEGTEVMGPSPNGMADALRVLGSVRMVSALPAAEGAVARSSRTDWLPR
jgi:hypothetical protein